MSRIERTLEAMASRGVPRGSTSLIARLEAQLVEDRRSEPTPRRASSPAGWWRGISVAAATAAAVFVVVLAGVLIVDVIGEDVDVVAPPSTTGAFPVDRFEGSIIARRSSIEVVGRSEFIVLLEDICCPYNALSDLAGGVAFQQTDMEILWARFGASGVEQPEPVLEAADGAFLSLEGLSVISEEPTIVALEASRNQPGRYTLITVGLVSGTETHTPLPYESSVTIDRVSYGDGLIVVSLIEDGRSRFGFLDVTGTPTSVDVNPRPQPGSSLVRQAVISNDGSELAYIERQASALTGGPGDLVIVDLESGRETDRRPVMSLGDRILSYDGEFVVIVRQRLDPEAFPATIVLHLSSGTWLSDG